MAPGCSGELHEPHGCGARAPAAGVDRWFGMASEHRPCARADRRRRGNFAENPCSEAALAARRKRAAPRATGSSSQTVKRARELSSYCAGTAPRPPEAEQIARITHQMPGKVTAPPARRDRGGPASAGLLAWLLALAACGPDGRVNRADVQANDAGRGGSGGGASGGTGGAGGRAGDGGLDGSGGTGGADAAGGDVGEASSFADASLLADGFDIDAPAPPPDAPPPRPDVPPGPPELARGRVGHWKLDEGRGNVGVDSSGIGNHGGTVNILMGDWQTGRNGTALAFTPTRRTFLIVASHPTIGPTEALSLSAWVRAQSWDGTPRILQKAEDDGEYGLRAEGDKLRFVLRLATVTAAEAPLPPPGRWVHIGATYDGREMRIYVDGSPVAMQPATGMIAEAFAPLLVGTGSQTGPATEFFSGLIDDVIIYERALSAAEVRLLSEGNSP
jgi:hypothetical protein